MGANYVKGRVAKITEKADGNLVLRYEDIEHGGRLVEAEYDLVVLAVGVQPNSDAQALFPEGGLSLDEFQLRRGDGRGRQPGPDEHPGRVRGRRSLRRQGHRRLDPARGFDGRAGGGLPGEGEGAGMTGAGGDRDRGSTSVTAAATSPTTSTSTRSSPPPQDEPGVVVARQMMFACSDAGQGDMERDIEEQQLDGLVVASCSPKLHVVTFRGVAKRAGLNPYEYTQVNVREQASWIHTDDAQANDGQGDQPGQGRDRPDPADRATRAHRGRDDPADPRGRRRRRRVAGRDRAGRHRPRRVPRGARGGPRRLGRDVRRDVPHRQERPGAHRRARRGDPPATCDPGLHRSRDGQQVGQLRQLPGRHPRRRGEPRDTDGRGRLDRRRPQASTPTSPRSASTATASTAS